MQSSNIETISRALEQSWSSTSSSKWKKSNPALGQCGVTALVVQDHLGGEIVKTKVVKQEVGELRHFYNLIESKPNDFTISQFDDPINYDNLPSSREEAFQDTNARQEYLSSAARRLLQYI